MARYNTLPDGSSLVETDDGRQVRTALPSAQLEQGFGATLDPELKLTARANDITKRIDDVRAKYDPNYAAAREEQKAKASDAAGRLEIDQKAGGLKRQIDEQRAQDLGGATALNTAIKPLAPGENRPPLSLTDAGGDAPLRIATPGEVALAQAPAPKQNLVPVKAATPQLAMPGQAAMSQPQGGGDQRLNAIGDMLVQGAYERHAPSRGGWVPRSRTTATEEVAPPEFLSNIDRAEAGVEDVARSSAEAKAKAYNEQIATPQLDMLEQNTAALEAAYKRRQAYDRELADKKKLADDTEKAAAEMKMPNVRDDYFDNNGGVFGRLLAGIAAGAGQWASMAPHGGTGNNAALGIINDNIKTHGQMLRDKYDQAKDNAAAKRNAYGQALSQYGDPETAMEALNLRGETIADRMIKVQMGRHLNTQEGAQLDQWLAQRKVDRAARWADAAGKAAGRTQSTEAYAAPSGGGTSINYDRLLKASQVYAKAGEGQKLDRAQLSNERAQRETAVHLPPEYARQIGQDTAFTTSADAAKEMKEQLQIAAGFRRAVTDLKDATDGFTSRPVTPEKRAKAKGAQAILTELGKNALGIKTITQYHMPLLHELSGAEATDLFTLGTTEQGREKVKQLEEGLGTMEAEHFKQMTRSPDKDDWIVPNVETER